MIAVRFHKGTMELADLPQPPPGPGEALVRVLVAGICNTDLELFKGYMNFSGTPGHEFVGVVERAPDAPHLEGRRVTADINAAPGHGDHRHASGRRVLGILGWDGAFAQYILAPVDNLHAVPDTLSDEAAVFAEPLAAALEVGQQVHIRATDRLAVLGDGKLGLLIAMALRHLCPGLVLSGKHPDKLAIASAQGVRTTLASDIAGPFDIVVEATGRTQGLEAALDLVRPEGTVVLKSTTEAKTPVNLARVVVQEITLVGSRCGDTALALDHLARGLVEPSGLVEAVYPLERFREAFESAARPGARKVLVRVSR
ncbi:D-arabitol-phosphate dehydrogenase [Fundidesulfovibrio magnetotacticus]|uniref:D-arabitol-phosphate dehydrogenase n=1 Tax=Fundidesulfovibrio magnetotacticus TaxID=2730080 RepID=A0A6V8M1C3_9BACT|nr:alcohol dehydrogenase catalytic domain-containing protein [Fundidesulfovibrio magnetotacticus]GFK94255.1 D-arabitol-phosphate dehydrogenase [Fundidesulfovibrio magnetotacticus]